MPATIDEQIIELRRQIEILCKEVSTRQRNNFWLGRALITTAILLGAAVVIAGLLDHPKPAAILAVAGGVIAAIESAFAIREAGDFQMIVKVEAENLLLPFQLGQVAEADLARYQSAFYTIKDNLAANIPRGTGMEASRKLGEDLAKAKT